MASIFYNYLYIVCFYENIHNFYIKIHTTSSLYVIPNEGIFAIRGDTAVVPANLLTEWEFAESGTIVKTGTSIMRYDMNTEKWETEIFETTLVNEVVDFTGSFHPYSYWPYVLLPKGSNRHKLSGVYC